MPTEIEGLILFASTCAKLVNEAVEAIQRHNAGETLTDRDLELAAAGRKSDIADMIAAVKAAPET